jgi:hypothetical protein
MDRDLAMETRCETGSIFTVKKEKGLCEVHPRAMEYPIDYGDGNSWTKVNSTLCRVWNSGIEVSRCTGGENRGKIVS